MKRKQIKDEFRKDDNYPFIRVVFTKRGWHTRYTKTIKSVGFYATRFDDTFLFDGRTLEYVDWCIQINKEVYRLKRDRKIQSILDDKEENEVPSTIC